MAKSEQLPSDALIAPAGILAGQPQHGLSKIRRDGWAAARAVRVAPASRDQIAVPAQQRRRSDQERAPRGAAQHPGQGSQEDSIGVLEIRSVDLTAEHRDLVAQHKDLDLCGAVTTQHQNQEPEDASQRAVGKRPEHGRRSCQHQLTRQTQPAGQPL